MQAWLASVEKDPLGKYAIFESSEIVKKWSKTFGLPLLPSHLHEIILFFFLHLGVYVGCEKVLSRKTKWYNGLPRSKKVGLGVHASSEFNALVTLVLSFPLFFSTSLDSLVSYTPYAGLVSAALTGYFVFDIFMCARDFQDNGLGFLCHAIAACFVYIQGNRPFMHNYSAAFTWFEASTTFVNINWLASNIPGLVSSQVETINGAILILVFLLCRVIPGPINGYNLFKIALTTDLPGVPRWVVWTIFGCYTVLTTLNCLWFSMMLRVAFNVLFRKQDIQQKHDPKKAADKNVSRAEARVMVVEQSAVSSERKQQKPRSRKI